MEWTPELEQWLREQTALAGFDAAGVAPVAAPESPSERLSAERFADWVDAGRAGEMEYLKRRDERGVLLRSGVQVAMPWARSVVVCAVNYNAAAPLSIDPALPGTGWIARYAWSGKQSSERREGAAEESAFAPTDYHDELLARLRQIEQALHERFGCETRCYVDTGPLVERTIAEQAGIGWIGKNTCVLTQQLGSWLLLAVIVTSMPVAESVPLQIAADRCGSCTRCIDACPTGALVAPREMDASRCIAYLTIEKKGAIPEDLREPMGRQVFGCDICQDVCPWNRSAPVTPREGMLPRPELMNPALDWLASLDEPAFRRWFKGSPLERTRRKRLHRNVAIAMGNSGEQGFLPQLDEWSAAEDPILAETAQWAARRIRSREEDCQPAALASSPKA
ncbi:tRNA epoxyqueuosine(34) reductase QueG [Edaphobacter bradus]|uniref:tRNA epoxyqueuosine(34) reductase QueG n=1 Tax=Edaphobacter bradus TaxID=2259016 RepID=UPI00295B9372|nr:tRNA epoxyqueuosine(34) reductase QueG [Edaphobacter bradus]